MCFISSDQATVQRYFNNGKKSNVQTDPSIGLSSVVVTNNNGVLQCQFNRSNSNNSIQNYFSLSNLYYVLLAKGPFSGILNLKEINMAIFIILPSIYFKGTPQQHTTTSISDSVVNFQINGTFTASPSDFNLAKVHGTIN